MANSAKTDFLNKTKCDNVSVAQMIKLYDLWKINGMNGVYDKLTTINAHKTNSKIKTTDLLRVYKCVYDYWYIYIKEHFNQNKLNNNQKAQVQSFLSMDKFKKENMSPEDCYEFVHKGFDKYLKTAGVERPMLSQHDNNPVIYGNGEVDGDFLHCWPFESSADISCRLYLNVKPENIASLAEKLIEKSYRDHRRIYFKFWTDDSRNDPFLIYTNYNAINRFIEILQEIKRENPKIFEGCENINPFLTKIDGFIGFGEEPKYKHSSFNLERAEAISEFSSEVVQKVVSEELKMIGNYSGTIRTSTGANLNIEEYLIYRLESSFRESLFKRQMDIANRNYPGNFVKNGTVHKYIAMENQIYQACKNELPEQVKLQIQAMAKNYLDALKAGTISRLPKIKFPTIDPELCQNYSVNYAKDYIARNGYIDYQIGIDINLQEKLFDVFGSEARIESVITDEALEPYFKNHHVSTLVPSLNTETEEEIRLSDPVSVE